MELSDKNYILNCEVNSLHTDLYQVTMVYAYWKAGRHNEKSVFDVFFRKNPFKGSFTIFSGLEEVIDYLKAYRFTQKQVDYIKANYPIKDEGFFDYLSNLDCSNLTLYCINDATFAFPREPLIRLEGPLGICQLIETPILNLLNFASLVTTNAARMKVAAGNDKNLIEFGLRRAQGPNGGLTASKYSFVGGFHGSSNLLAGFHFNMQILGTQAHAFIQSFVEEKDLPKEVRMMEGVDVYEKCLEYRKTLEWENTNDEELLAFVAYAVAFPNNFLALVDTYNTLGSGVKNFLLVALVMDDIGQKATGIRLDSGDLGVLSLKAKEMFIEVGKKFGKDFSHLKVCASNDINEEALHELNANGHGIDIFGIGTHLVTCQAQPALGMVYKLVDLNGVSRIKLSEDIEKITIPGRKKIFRAYINEVPKYDVMLREEEDDLKPDVEYNLISSLADHKKESKKAERYERVNNKLMDNGKVTEEMPSLEKRRQNVLNQLDTFDKEIFKKNQPIKYGVYLSEYLFEDMMKTISKEKKETK